MLMEIYLSEEKAKKNNINLEECYQKIDNYFLKHGVKIKSPGVYQGVKKDFGTFVTAQWQLPDTKWFLLYFSRSSPGEKRLQWLRSDCQCQVLPTFSHPDSPPCNNSGIQ